MNVKGEEVIFSTGTVEWETPQGLFDSLNNEFEFTLDPCATNENHKCDKFFTKEDNGLEQDWSGHSVFCNPPYGRKNTGDWVAKCASEANHCKNVVMLIPARTDTKWFHKYIYGKAKEIRFIKGRVKFESVDGKKDAAPFPSMIVVF